MNFILSVAGALLLACATLTIPTHHSADTPVAPVGGRKVYPPEDVPVYDGDCWVTVTNANCEDVSTCTGTTGSGCSVNIGPDTYSANCGGELMVQEFTDNTLETTAWLVTWGGGVLANVLEQEQEVDGTIVPNPSTPMYFGAMETSTFYFEGDCWVGGTLPNGDGFSVCAPGDSTCGFTAAYTSAPTTLYVWEDECGSGLEVRGVDMLGWLVTRPRP